MASGRIPALDGLRAVSIGLVLAAHSLGTTHLPMWNRSAVFGDLGVRTFFVISGFLITTLLMRETEKTGRISLRGFYTRRFFRIFPAFYVYLGTIAILCAVGWIYVSGTDFAFAATYTINFHADRAWWVGHLWSLSVEEQFYFLWPAALVVLGLRRGMYFAIIAIVAAPFLRVGAWHSWPAAQPLVDQAFPFVFDALATGCVLALLRDRLEASPRYTALISSPAFWVIPLGVIAAMLITNPDFNFGFAFTFANLGIALTIHRCVRYPERFATATILESAPLVWVGGMSYSLYLWQQPFLNRHMHAWFTAFPVNILCAVAIACISFYVVEQPILKWRGQRRPPKDPQPSSRK